MLEYWNTGILGSGPPVSLPARSIKSTAQRENGKFSCCKIPLDGN